MLATVLPSAALANVVPKQSDASVKTECATPPICPSKIKRPSTLLPDRYLSSIYTGGFCDCPAEKGMVVELAKFTPSPLGDQYPVMRPGDHSGQPMGILLNDVVQVDLTKRLLVDAIPIGGRVEVCQGGWLIVGPFDEPVSVGQHIYYDRAGRLTTETTGRPIGYALSSNQDGFVKVEIRLYVNENAKLFGSD